MKSHIVRRCATLLCATFLVSLCVQAVYADEPPPKYKPTPRETYRSTPTPTPKENPVYTPEVTPTPVTSTSPCPAPDQPVIIKPDYRGFWVAIVILAMLLLLVSMFAFRRRKPGPVGYPPPGTPYDPQGGQQQGRPDKY